MKQTVEKTEGSKRKKVKGFRRVLAICLVIVTLLGMLPSSVFAADGSFDGWGDVSGGGGAVSGDFSLSKASSNPVYGYRFSVYDSSGDKAGHSIDIVRQSENSAAYAVYKDDKKSHIEIWEEYKRYGSVDLGSFSTKKNDESAYMYYDTSLPGTPTEMETTLTSEYAKDIAEKCGAAAKFDVNTSYIIVEPLYNASLVFNGSLARYRLTIAEFAVYQASIYGWSSVPSSYTSGTYTDIMFRTSMNFPRHLFAKETYPFSDGTGEMKPITDSMLSSSGTKVLLNESLSNQFNTSAKVLEYQVGMGVYTKFKSENPEVEFNVRHYLQNLDGTYSSTPVYTETGTGIVGDTITIADYARSYTGYYYAEGMYDGDVLTSFELEEAPSSVGLYYKRNTYTITWKNEDGTTLETDTGVMYGATPTYNGATPTKVADAQYTYTFAGWNPSVSAVTGNVTYTATYNKTVRKYTVTLNRGTGISSVSGANTYEYGTSVTIDAELAANYQWSGWTGSFSQSSKKYTFTVTGNVTLTANATVMTGITYKVEHYQQNVAQTGYTLYDTETKSGTAGASLTLANLKQSYTGFTYAYGQVGGSTVTTTTILADGTRVIKLYYNRQSYTVTLNKGTGVASVSGAATYVYGATVNVNATVSSGYDWSGWSGDVSVLSQSGSFTMPAYNVTLTANATEETATTPSTTFTIKYNANGGSIGTVTSTVIAYDSSADMTSNIPSRTGYTFMGWAVTSSWNTDRIAYSSGKGGGTASDGSVATISSVKTGQEWAAYFDKDISSSSDSITLYAQWEATDSGSGDTETTPTTTFTIYYNVNGGSGTISSTVISYGSSADIRSTVPTRTGYTFMGWATTSAWNKTRIAYSAVNGGSTASDGSKATISSSKTAQAWASYFGKDISNSSASVTLYAQWEAEEEETTPSTTFTIRYNVNGGSGSISNTVISYGSSGDITNEVPTREGYIFYGWATTSAWNTNRLSYYSDAEYGGAEASDGTKASRSTKQTAQAWASYFGKNISTSSASVTLYAQWEAEEEETTPATTFTINYNLNGASGSASSTVMSYGNIGNIRSVVPTRAGYIFMGWATTSAWNKTRIAYSAAYGGGIALDGTKASIASAKSAQDWAAYFGKDISTSDATVTLYAQWEEDSSSGSETYTVTLRMTGPSNVCRGAIYEGMIDSDSFVLLTSTSTSSTVATCEVTAGTKITLQINRRSSAVIDSVQDTYTGENIPFTDYSTYIHIIELVVTEDIDYTAYVSTTSASQVIVGYRHWLMNADRTGLTIAENGETYSLMIVGSTINISDVVGSYEGYTFINAYNSETGDLLAGTITVPEGGIIINFIYDLPARTYFVKWLNYDNTVLETDVDVAEGSTPTYNGATPTKPADAQYTYTFSGWSPEISPVTGDTIYTAQFTPVPRTYTVTWKNGSTTLETDTGVAYGSTPTYNGATPTKASTAQYSYTFSGWTPAISAVTGNVTYTAQFTQTVRKYTVTWKNWDGTILETDTGVAYGTMPTYNATTPTKPSDAQYNYTFSSWSPTVSAVTGNVIYTAVFSNGTQTYTVTWKNGSTTLETDTGVAYGSTPTYNGATPTKASTAQYSYTFSGWSPAVSAVTGDVTYTAQFTQTVRKYTVTWKNGSTTLETDTGVAYGTTPTYNGTTPTKASTAQYSYTFSGWSPAVSAVTGNVTYTAQFTQTVRKYTVTWENWDGTILETDTGVAYGTTPAYNGKTPTKPSDVQYTYTFSGWSPTISTVTGNVTYTATFSNGTQTYTVTWKNWDGAILETDTGVAYGTTPAYNGKTPTKPSDVQYTYTFSGWSPAISTVTGNVTYTAVFSSGAQTYTVTWKNSDGTVLETDTGVAYGTTPTYNGATPTKASSAQYSYTFSGWSPAVSAVTGNVTYTAQFTATQRTYTITLNKQKGTGGTGKFYEVYGIKFYTNTSSQVSVNSISIPSRTGYTFDGYYTKTNGAGTPIINASGKILVAYTHFKANTTVYANWIPNPDTSYQINHYLMDVSGVYPNDPTETEYLEGETAAELTLADLAKSYIGFTYSYGQVNGSTVATTTIAADGSRIVDLYYARNRYTLTVDNGAGISTVSGAGIYYFGQSVTVNASVSSGYTWYKWTGDISTPLQMYSFTMPASDITVTANASPVLEIEPIAPNALYRKNTQVISAFRIINPGELSYTGAEDVVVNFHITNTETGAVITTGSENTIIVPALEKGIVYIKWAVPASVTGNYVTIKATISMASLTWDTASIVHPVTDFTTGTTPDTDYEDTKPDGWVHNVGNLNNIGNATWEEWKYENGNFKKVSYTVQSSVSATVMPGTGETHWMENGLWHMRSGYGIACNVTVSISAPGVPAAAYTQAQYIKASFPEYSYSLSARMTAILSKYANGWQFAATEYGNYHFTPIWFPDGAYVVNYYATDCWTPVGMISASKSSNTIIIEGNMYDDWYVGRP